MPANCTLTRVHSRLLYGHSIQIQSIPGTYSPCECVASESVSALILSKTQQGRSQTDHEIVKELGIEHSCYCWSACLQRDAVLARGNGESARADNFMFRNPRYRRRRHRREPRLPAVYTRSTAANHYAVKSWSNANA